MATQAAPRERQDSRSGARVWRTELSPVSFLVRAAEVHTRATALVHGDRRWSYGELHERVARLTSALRGLGIEDGDRVAVLGPEHARDGRSPLRGARSGCAPGLHQHPPEPR
jgi:non-ribosomal peptide synthetase component E (peptide arylation enzyme)